MTEDELLSTKGAASRLGVTHARIRHLIAEGRLPAQKLGGGWVIKAADLAQVAHRPTGWPKGRKRKSEPTDDA